METSAAFEQVLAGVGPRLRQLRQQRGTTLAALSRATGISVSTLSRLESGLRRPSLELLLPIARAHQVTLDELVGDVPVGDPRVQAAPRRVGETVYVPLTQKPGRLQAFKIIIPATMTIPDPQTHEGYEWLYVLSGRLRLIVANHDVIMEPGQAAEFDTRLPHWCGSTGSGAVEILSLFGPQGERIHLRGRAQVSRPAPA